MITPFEERINLYSWSQRLPLFFLWGTLFFMFHHIWSHFLFFSSCRSIVWWW